MTATGLADPRAVEALTRIDPTLARLIAMRPIDARRSSWHLHDVRWTPGQRCHFTYRVVGNGPPTFVSEWLTTDGWATQDFVDDTALPGLTRATDSLLLTSRLGGLCRGPIRSCRVEAVRYRPGLRCVLRYDVETATTRHTLYAKAFPPEVFARLAPMAVALAGRPTAGAMLPHLGEIWSDLKILVGWGVSGSTVSAVLADDRIPCGERPELGYRLGELLARFHALGGVPAATWSQDDQLTALERAMPAVEAADPDFATRLWALLDTLTATVPGSREDVLAHGSFRPGQVIVSDDGQLTVLDTDEVCRSDRGLDLGVALAHLRWQGVRQPLARDGLLRIEHQLLAGYRRVAGPVDEDMLLWWRAAGLLKVAVRRYRRLEVESWSRTPALAAAAEALLRAPTAKQRREHVDLLDVDRMSTVLSSALRPSAASPPELEVGSAAQLAVAPDRRAVMRYDVNGLNGGKPVTVIGKVFADADRARLLHEHLTLLSDGPFHETGYRVPTPMGLVHRYRMVLYRHFDGVRLDRIGNRPDVESGVAASARWLRRLHTSEVLLPRTLSVDQEIASTRQWAELITDCAPHESQRARALGAGWVVPDRVIGPHRLRPIHKDFHAGHVLLGDGVCVIDLDEARMGEPAFDIAHFCVYLELFWGVRSARRLTEIFLREYADHDGSGSAELEPSYAAYTWLKVAKQWAVRSGPCRHASSSERLDGIDRALARAESWLNA